MYYIYMITNKINQKIYIGQTSQAPEQRWKEHQIDARKESLKNRPLYRAINKYGIENFIFEVIEATRNPVEREVYWISQYNTFQGEGYNATRGGEGRSNIVWTDKEIEVLTSLRKENKSIIEIKEILPEKGELAISNKLKELGFDVSRNYKTKKRVAQIDPKTNKIIKVYESMQATQEDGFAKSHVSSVANGKRLTHKGFKWEFLD